MNQDLEDQDQPKDSEHLTPDDIAELVRDLSKTMRDTGVSRLSVKHRDLQIRLSTASGKVEAGANRPSPHSEPTVESSDVSIEGSTDYVVTAPMIGTFYTSSAPNEPPFVQIGDVLEEGQTVGIIEAMKIMNEIATDRAGQVIEIIAANGETVEYGSPLVVLNPDSS